MSPDFLFNLFRPLASFWIYRDEKRKQIARGLMAKKPVLSKEDAYGAAGQLVGKAMEEDDFVWQAGKRAVESASKPPAQAAVQGNLLRSPRFWVLLLIAYALLNVMRGCSIE